MTGRVFVGPMQVIAWLVAGLWLALGVGAGLLLALPWQAVGAVVGIVGAVATAWVALTMRLTADAEGLDVPGHGHVRWADVDRVAVRPGIVAVPEVTVRRGRALLDVPLDGLAWFGGADGFARTLAQQVADAAGAGPVVVHGRTSSVGRRAARD